MKIKVLGTGCARCNSLLKLVNYAIADLNLNADIDKVDDIQKIIAYGVMRTPALVINEEVVLTGQLPSLEYLKKIILDHK